MSLADVSTTHPETVTVWAEIVDEARWAPSPHNTQAWQIEARSEREADLFVPGDRLLPVEDPDGRFLTAGLGIFLEALAVSASARGFELVWKCAYPSLGLDAEERPFFASLRLEDDGTPGDDRGLLARRRTSRLPYDGRPAPEEALRELASIADSFGHEARFSSRTDLVDWIVGLNVDTVFYDLDEDDRRREIGRWTHSSERRAQRSGDGFSPRCLGFSGLLVRAFFDHHRLFGFPPLRRLARRRYLRSLRGTATVGWIAGPWGTPPEWLDAGRMLLRFWLALTAHGLYLQPFGSVITNSRAHARLAERLDASEADEREIWLLLRIGYSAEPPRSARRPLAEILQ